MKGQDIIVEHVAPVPEIFRWETISDDDQVKSVFMVPKMDNE